MASISNETALVKATSLHCGHFRPISSPFERHDREINGS